MKNTRNLLIALLLLLAMVVPGTTAYATAVKLDATSKTVTVGKTTTVKLLNNKNAVTWSVSNGKVQITKSTKTYAKIKGVTKGAATLKAKVGKKTYSCKVTVKPVISISKSATSLVEGNSETISLINATASKVKWSSNKTSVATVSKGKITAKKAGTATITAKYDGKSYKCKVTVTAAPIVFDAKKAENAITKTEMIVNHRLFVKLDSDYDFATDISAKVNYYDSNGRVVDYRSDSFTFLEKGHEAFLEFYLPDSEYSSYDISYEYSEGLKYFYHTAISDKVSLEVYETEEYIMAQLTNSSDVECNRCIVTTIYYDAEGNIIDIVENYLDDAPANSSSTTKLSKPSDNTSYRYLEYDHYESFISSAYHSGK